MNFRVRLSPSGCLVLSCFILWLKMSFRLKKRTLTMISSMVYAGLSRVVLSRGECIPTIVFKVILYVPRKPSDLVRCEWPTYSCTGTTMYTLRDKRRSKVAMVALHPYHLQRDRVPWHNLTKHTVLQHVIDCYFELRSWGDRLLYPKRKCLWPCFNLRNDLRYVHGVYISYSDIHNIHLENQCCSCMLSHW